jgi:hypothetical protein
MVEVHHFKVWNINTGDWEYPPPYKRTAEAIAETKGEITPETMEMVFLSMLDSQGRYFPNIREQEDT